MLARGATLAAVALSLLAALPSRGAAQAQAPERAEAPLLGSEREDRARIRQVLGADSSAGWLVRSLSRRLAMPAIPDDSLAWTPLAPELFLVHNTELPFSQNDGLLWAGRGLNVRLRGGIAGALGPWRLVLMPEVALSRNQGFTDVDQVVEQWYRPPLDVGRFSEFASPWNQNPVSADVPVRFGTSAYRRASLGQSSLWWEGGRVAAGLSSENLWWGPGLRDALVMTNNAAGVSHAFVRTARPWRLPFGEVEAEVVLGVLRESAYFDRDPDNDARSLSAGVLTFRPSGVPNLTVGVARAVYAPVDGVTGLVGHALDVARTFDRPGARALADTSFTAGRDQLASLFARWVFPEAGWEFHGEIGRAERPANLRDFLADPSHSRAYLFGGQHVRRVGGDGVIRVQAEFVQMEQSPSYRYRPTPSWYTSRASPQGYTHQGQVIGSSVGPGSSHQWLAADYVAPTWTAGAFFGRWRFNTDAMYASIGFPPGTGWCEYDTTLYPGARGSVRSAAFGLVQAELILGNRMNAFHQNNSGCPAPDVGGHYRDVRNRTLRITITPRLP